MFDRLRSGFRGTSQQIVLGVALAFICVLTIEGVNHAITWESHAIGDDGTGKVSMRSGKDRLVAKIKGEVAFADDNGSVERLAPGAYFELETRDSNGRRSLRVTSGTDGHPNPVYKVDGGTQPMDGAGREWLQHHLLRLYRHSGVHAGVRAARLLQQGGVSEVLAEILELETSSVRRQYFETLLTRGGLSDEELAEVLGRAREDLGSSYELGKLVAELDPSHLESLPVRQAFVAMAASIPSDNRLRRSLTALISEPLEPWFAETLLEAAGSIGSDHEMSKFLMAVSEAYPVDVPLPEGFLLALRDLSSDSEHRRASTYALQRHQVQPESFRGLLEAARGVDSDHELARLLSEVAERQTASEVLPAEYFSAAATLQSNHELRRALEANLGAGPLHPETLKSVLKAARGFNSNHEQVVLLLHVLADQTLNEEHLASVEEIARNIASEHERGRLEERLDELAASVEGDGLKSAHTEAISPEADTVEAGHLDPDRLDPDRLDPDRLDPDSPDADVIKAEDLEATDLEATDLEVSDP